MAEASDDPGTVPGADPDFPGTLLYFAYGSNMYPPRLQSRVPSAGVISTARLPGYELAFRKRGNDGSTKCDIEPVEPETVWGVIYRIDTGERPLLDEVEGEGYRIVPVTVSTGDRFIDAFTYRAHNDWICWGRPYDWYRDMVAAGARYHDLPPMYCEAISLIDADPDPDAERAARARSML